jgi:hypothetical protein
MREGDYLRLRNNDGNVYLRLTAPSGTRVATTQNTNEPETLWQLESVPENSMRFRFRNVHTNLYLGCNHGDDKKPYTKANLPGWHEAWGIVELDANHLPEILSLKLLLTCFLSYPLLVVQLPFL